jgi:hypothetical protein
MASLVVSHVQVRCLLLVLGFQLDTNANRLGSYIFCGFCKKKKKKMKFCKFSTNLTSARATL